MGDLIWHDWARFVSLFASIYGIWAGFWGLFYRKFFWDFVGGVRMDTATQKGIIPGPNSAPFIAVIVTIPLIQILVMVTGTFMVMLEYPAPFMKRLPIHRSLVFRVVMLVVQAFLAILFYQGTNAAVYSTVAAIGYIRAMTKGETLEEAKDNRGKAGAA